MPDKPKTRDPRPGEDWTSARCARPQKRWGPCVFCGEEIKPSYPRNLRARLRGEQAHYTCAPGLGVDIVREG